MAMASRGTFGALAALLLGFAASAPYPARADDVLLRSFGSGSGADNLGIAINTSTEDQEEDGPQALYAADDGKLYVLDQINGRILNFDPSKPAGETRSYELPRDIQPTDLIVRNDDILVWDGKVHTLAPLGAADQPVRGLTETRSGEPVDDVTRSTFAQMGSEVVDDSVSTRGLPGKKPPAESARQYIATRSHGSVAVVVTTTDGGAGAQLAVRAKDAAKDMAKLRLRVRDKIGSVSFLDIDRNGRMFVLAENIPTDTANPASAFVARYSAAGALEGVYELPLSQTVAVSRRAVTISPDGDVYFLRTKKNAVDIVGIGFHAMPNAKVVDFGTRLEALAAPLKFKGVSVAVGPLTRQRVVDTAYAFEGIQWTLTPSAYGSDPDQVCNGFGGRRIRRPMYLIGKLNQQVRSVPYCWGCQGSLAQFASQIQRGTMAGNVCTKNDPRPGVAGVDCSSFVSATWGLSTHFTTAVIPSIAHQLSNPWDLLPGDALDKPGSHVVLFLGFTADRKAMVMEASPGACNGKVCRNVYPLSSLLARGFIPVRYRALADAK